MNNIKRIGRGLYYRRLFSKNRKEIKKLFSLLADDKSRHTLECILSAYKTMFHDPYSYLRRAADDDCREYHFTAPDGYKVYGTQNPYFLNDIFSINSETVLLDGGAYIGDTVRLLDNVTKGRFRYIYSFEPDPGNYQKLIRTAEAYKDRISCYNSGIDNHDGKASFIEDDAGSRLSVNGTSIIKIIDIGKFLQNAEHGNPTFIKLDIEGNEPVVLEAMGDYIKKNNPDMAVSIYHKLEDLWEIPIRIHSLSDKYSIYIRHQSNYFTETVCYASVREKKHDYNV